MQSHQAIIEECKAILQQHYGTHFAGLYLYGSVARHQEEASSDIDLLVLLAKPVAKSEFEAGKLHFYRTVQQEGVAA